MNESRKMLVDILDDPDEYEKHVTRLGRLLLCSFKASVADILLSLPGAVAMLNFYGHRGAVLLPCTTLSPDDPLRHKWKRTIDT